MLVDWFTVGAQILNFLILVFLLKIFLYDKVVAAMDRREQTVAERLEQARHDRDEADRERRELAEKWQDLERQKQDFLEQARSDAEDKRKELIVLARRDVDGLRRRWEESLNRERDSFLRELNDMAAGKVLAACRAALRDLASLGEDELRHKAVDAFIERVADMDPDQAKRLAEAGKKSGLTVRTSHELTSAKKGALTKALRQALDSEPEVDYRVDPDLVLGLEARASGVKLAWSLSQYLDDLDQLVTQAMEDARQEPRNNAGDSAGQDNGQESGDGGEERQ